MTSKLESLERYAREEWRPVLGYEGLYEVSDMGRVRSIDREYTTKDGRKCRVVGRLLLIRRIARTLHLRVSLCRDNAVKGFFVHRLVMAAFIGPSKLPVNHRDGNPQNNNLENLEYVSTRENINHYHGGKYKYPTGVTFRGKRYASQCTIKGIKTYLGSFDTPQEAHAKYMETVAALGEGRYAR